MNIANCFGPNFIETDDSTKVEVICNDKQIFCGTKHDLLNNSDFGEMEMVRGIIKGDFSLVFEVE